MDRAMFDIFIGMAHGPLSYSMLLSLYFQLQVWSHMCKHVICEYISQHQAKAQKNATKHLQTTPALW